MQDIIASINKENDSYQNYYIFSIQLEIQLLEYALKGKETQLFLTKTNYFAEYF